MNRTVVTGILAVAFGIGLCQVVGCGCGRARKAGAALGPTNSLRLPSGERLYLLGVSYPWLTYARDFGSAASGHDGISTATNRRIVDEDFAYLREHGVRVVRWCMFGDGRASPEFDSNGLVTGFDKHFYRDVDAALALAEKHDVYLIFIMFDYTMADAAKVVDGMQTHGRSRVITDPHVRQSLLDKAITPLLKKYGSNPRVVAWEVMNVPEGAMDIPGAKLIRNPVSGESMQAFVKAIVDHIHKYSKQHATIGCNSLTSLKLWTASKLDFYEYLYSEDTGKEAPFERPFDELELDKPCVIAEFPTGNAKRSVTDYLDPIRDNGYAGALAWSLRGGDDISDFESVADEFAEWAEGH